MLFQLPILAAVAFAAAPIFAAPTIEPRFPKFSCVPPIENLTFKIQAASSPTLTVAQIGCYPGKDYCRKVKYGTAAEGSTPQLFTFGSDGSIAASYQIRGAPYDQKFTALTKGGLLVGEQSSDATPASQTFEIQCESCTGPPGNNKQLGTNCEIVSTSLGQCLFQHGPKKDLSFGKCDYTGKSKMMLFNIITATYN